MSRIARIVRMVEIRDSFRDHVSSGVGSDHDGVHADLVAKDYGIETYFANSVVSEGSGETLFDGVVHRSNSGNRTRSPKTPPIIDRLSSAPK